MSTTHTLSGLPPFPTVQVFIFPQETLALNPSFEVFQSFFLTPWLSVATHTRLNFENCSGDEAGVKLLNCDLGVPWITYSQVALLAL